MKKDWTDIRVIRRYIADFRCKLGPHFVFITMQIGLQEITACFSRNEFGLWKRDDFPCDGTVPLDAELLSLHGDPVDPSTYHFVAGVQWCSALFCKVSCFMGIFCHGWSSHHILSWHPKLRYYSCLCVYSFLPHLTSLNHSTFRSDDEAIFFMRTSATSSCAKLCCCFVQEKEGEMVMDRSGKLDFSLRLVFGDDEPWREALIRGINNYRKCS